MNLHSTQNSSHIFLTKGTSRFLPVTNFNDRKENILINARGSAGAHIALNFNYQADT